MEASWGRLWGVLGASWRHLGRLGGVLQASWRRLGGILAAKARKSQLKASKCHFYLDSVRSTARKRNTYEGNPPICEDVSSENATFKSYDGYQDSRMDAGRGLPALRGGPPRAIGPQHCWRPPDARTPQRGPKRSRHPSFFASCRHLASSCWPSSARLPPSSLQDGSKTGSIWAKLS